MKSGKPPSTTPTLSCRGHSWTKTGREDHVDEIGDYIAPGHLCLDLERHSHLSQLQDAKAFLSLYRDKLVCIDEVQLRPDLFPLLRALIDDHLKPGRFLILAS